MGFLNPGYLFALVGAGLPIVIHLLTRDRVRRVQFSTLRFFVRNSSAVLRRRRIRELILLIMRCVACGLLALAFARPIFGVGVGDATAEGAIVAETIEVIVLDRSASMRRAGLMDAARERALERLSQLDSSTDAAGLVTFDMRSRVVVPLTGAIGDVEGGISGTDAGAGGTDIAGAVRQASELLRPARAQVRRIAIVSDFQASGWESYTGDWKLQPGVELAFENVSGEETAGNCAIVALEHPQGIARDASLHPISARIANYGTDDVPSARVSLDIAGTRVASRTLNLKAGSTTPVRFRVHFDNVGDNPGSISVDVQDSQSGDNTMRFNVRVIPRIRVLILNGRPTGRPATDAAFFLETALAPSDESPFEVRSIDAARVTRDDLTNASVVILSNVLTVAPEIRDALSLVLNRGGGLLFVPGDLVRPDVFDGVFGPLAPCNLRRVMVPRPRAGGTREVRIAEVDYDHPVFGVFQLPHHGDLSGVRFFKYWELTDSQLARVSARFDDGRPAVVDRQIGAGLSMLISTAVDLQWTDLPRRAVFLPLIHQITRHLAIRTEPRTLFTVGDVLRLDESSTVRSADGTVLERDAAGNVQLVDEGLFTIADAQGASVRTIAVNRPFGESDPTTIDTAEIRASVSSSVGEAGVSSDINAVGGVRSDRHHVWWYLTAALAILLVGELALAGKTPRH